MAREAYRLTKDIFVQRANDIHNFQYIYDNSDFVNTRTKLTITCPIHGDFVQTPKNHLNGQGCPLCGKIKAHPTKEEKINNFIKQSQKDLVKFMISLTLKMNMKVAILKLH